MPAALIGLTIPESFLPRADEVIVGLRDRSSDLPDGRRSRCCVQPLSQKYSHSLLTQITSTSVASRPTHKGRFAIVTNVGQGMRWTRAALLTRCAWLADGEVVWS